MIRPNPGTVRRFEFDRTVPLGAAVRTIAAALDDEGLVLTEGDNCTATRITSVIVDGRMVVVVPSSRIRGAAR